MGLREATILLLIFGAVAVAAADSKHRPDHGKAGAKPAKAPPPAAERPDPAAADGAAATTDDAKAKEDQAASEVDRLPFVTGPKRVDLGNSTEIELPEGFHLYEKAQAEEISRKLGNGTDGLVAMVVKPGSEWLVVIEYDASGYVDDSDADELDADELMDSYRKGTEEQNKRRKALGVSELFLDSWSEKPRYEKPLHHLVWGLAGHSTEGKVINFFTRILGRNGYLSVNLIDEPERIEASKKEALAILQATRFKPGAAYADHVDSDRSSGIGLRGLVLGGAGVAVASKIGLFAKILLVFKKLFIVVIAAIGGLFRWLFRRKPRETQVDPLAGVAVSGTGAPPQGQQGAWPQQEQQAWPQQEQQAWPQQGQQQAWPQQGQQPDPQQAAWPQQGQQQAWPQQGQQQAWPQQGQQPDPQQAAWPQPPWPPGSGRGPGDGSSG